MIAAFWKLKVSCHGNAEWYYRKNTELLGEFSCNLDY